MIKQLSHKESNHSEKVFPIVLICDGFKKLQEIHSTMFPIQKIKTLLMLSSI
jgi:hypothetical protein